MGKHAVVLGASIGGLLAAQVLSEFYDQVTVVERDALPDGDEQRRGVPQGRHIHALLAGGSLAIEELFPGILDELVADGAVVAGGDDLSAFWQEIRGNNLRRESGTTASQLRIYQSTRPFLEGHIRRRLRSSDGVTFRDEHDVTELITVDGRVTGARITPHRGGPEAELPADLVVDAMGRNARTPALLEAMGYGRPPESSVEVNIAYASQLLRIGPPAPEAKVFLIGPAPGRSSGGALAALEKDTWMFTALGYGSDAPPTDWEGLVRHATRWAPEPVLAALRRAEPIGAPSRYRYPTSQRRRYDRMRGFPEGLLVFGDAICSFNPIYGQGMSVAALEAVALRRCLRDGSRELGPRFFAATVKPIDVAWQMAMAADLTIPTVPGRRTLTVRGSNWYTNRVLARCAADIAVFESFFRVMNLLDPPSRLMSPSMMRRVLGPVQSSSDAPSRSAAAT